MQEKSETMKFLQKVVIDETVESEFNEIQAPEHIDSQNDGVETVRIDEKFLSIATQFFTNELLMWVVEKVDWNENEGEAIELTEAQCDMIERIDPTGDLLSNQ